MPRGWKRLIIVDGQGATVQFRLTCPADNNPQVTLRDIWLGRPARKTRPRNRAEGRSFFPPSARCDLANMLLNETCQN